MVLSVPPLFRWVTRCVERIHDIILKIIIMRIVAMTRSPSDVTASFEARDVDEAMHADDDDDLIVSHSRAINLPKESGSWFVTRWR